MPPVEKIIDASRWLLAYYRAVEIVNSDLYPKDYYEGCAWGDFVEMDDDLIESLKLDLRAKLFGCRPRFIVTNIYA